MTGREDSAGEAREAREEAAWRAIVENFGDRAELSEPPAEPSPVPAVSESPPAELVPVAWEDEGHYVPPPPPPLPRPRGARLAAWFGLFGVPTIALLCVVLGVSIPSPGGLLLIVWFVGGFGYLVATMSGRDPDSGWDDGAVL